MLLLGCVMHPASTHIKTSLQIPTHGQQRLRAQTITTPTGTPHVDPLAFLSDAQIQDLVESRSRNWDRLPTEIKANILCFLSATDKIRCRAVFRLSTATYLLTRHRLIESLKLFSQMERFGKRSIPVRSTRKSLPINSASSSRKLRLSFRI